MSKYIKHFLHMAVALVLILFLVPTIALAAESETVAVIGETGYTTLQAAIDAAQDEDTITLVADVAEVVAFTRPAGMSVTIDGDGHAFNGIIYVGDEANTNPVADLTVKNCVFSNRSLHYAVELLPGANAVTVENCTAQGYKYGLMRVASSTAVVTVSDTQVQNVSFGAVVEACIRATFQNMTVSNTDYGIAAMNTCENDITVDSCTFDNVRSPIHVEEMDESVVTFTFLGVTDLGMCEVVDEETWESVMMPGSLPESDYVRIVAATQIGSKVYERLQDAINTLQADATVTLLGNVTEVLTFNRPQGICVTIDGNGHSFSGIIYVGDESGNPVADLTVKNCAFSNRWQHYALELLPGANTVTVKNCTAQGYKYGLMMVSSPTAKVTVSDTLVQNVSYAAVIDTCAEAIFRNVTVSNTSFGIAAMNACENAITVDSCTFENVQNPIYVEEVDEAVVSFTFLGITDLGMCEVVDEETWESVMMPARLPVSDYIRIVAGAQVGTKLYADFHTAIQAAEDGACVIFVTDITTDTLTISKNLIIDGAGFRFTGILFVENVDLTVQNLHFVNGYIDNDEVTGSGGSITVRDCSFSGNDRRDNAIELGNVLALTVENCTVKDYHFSFLRALSPEAAITVNNVSVQAVPIGAFISAGNSVSFRQFTMIGGEFGIAVENAGVAQVNVEDCAFDGIANPFYIEETGETDVTILFQGVTDLGMFESVDEETWESVMMPAGLPFSDYAHIVAAAQSVTRIYGDLQNAINAAEAGETVSLLMDLSLEELTVRTERTLDLNGMTLQVTYLAAFKGANVIDSSADNTGLLAAPGMDHVVLPADNAQLPVWNGNGYLFTQLSQPQLQQSTTAEGHTEYTFQPHFAPIACPYLAQGAESSAVKIALRLTWSDDTGVHHQDYVWQDNAVANMLGGNTNALRAVLRNTSGMDVQISAVVICHAGTELSCPLA